MIFNIDTHFKKIVNAAGMPIGLPINDFGSRTELEITGFTYTSTLTMAIYLMKPDLRDGQTMPVYYGTTWTEANGVYKHDMKYGKDYFYSVTQNDSLARLVIVADSEVILDQEVLIDTISSYSEDAERLPIAGGGSSEITIDDVIGLPEALSGKISTSAIGAANGVPSLDSTGKVPASMLPTGSSITVIPAATSTYTLADGSYKHIPNNASTYKLAAAPSTSMDHQVILDIDFTNSQSAGFETTTGTEILPEAAISIKAGDIWRFICIYSFTAWHVYPLPVYTATGGVPTTIIVQGTTATSAGLAGYYIKQSDTMNDHPIWKNDTNSKYIWLVESGMEPGYFGWVIGSTVAQQSAGDIPMFYDYFVTDVTSPADTPVGLTWRTQMEELTSAQFTVVEG